MRLSAFVELLGLMRQTWSPCAAAPRGARTLRAALCARGSSSTSPRQGLSNAEIADRLVLSVRTVESDIYRTMQKIGVGARRQL